MKVQINKDIIEAEASTETLTTEAVYENGLLRLVESLALAEGTRVWVSVAMLSGYTHNGSNGNGLHQDNGSGEITDPVALLRVNGEEPHEDEEISDNVQWLRDLVRETEQTHSPEAAIIAGGGNASVLSLDNEHEEEPHPNQWILDLAKEIEDNPEKYRPTKNLPPMSEEDHDRYIYGI